MAKIVPSDLAPSEIVHYFLAGVDFDLGGSGKGSKASYQTDDRAVLSNAEAHPWLSVDFGDAAEVGGIFAETQVRPEDDSQGALGPNAGIAFDPKEIEKIEAAKAEAVYHPAGIEAGLDQNEVVTEAGIDQTVAAVESDATTTEKDN